MAPQPQRLSVARRSWPLAETFAISRGSRTTAEVVVAEISDGEFRGRGECVPYPRYGESVDSVVQALEGDGGRGVFRARPRGAADARCRPARRATRSTPRSGISTPSATTAASPIWPGSGKLNPLVTAYTLSLDTPERMGEAAAAQRGRPLLKLKLTGDGDLERVRAVRAHAPAARLIVDANEGWTARHFAELVPALAELGVELIEQPLPAGADDALAELPHPIPVCADESCHTSADLDRLIGKYDAVNIKLDKIGRADRGVAAGRRRRASAASGSWSAA